MLELRVLLLRVLVLRRRQVRRCELSGGRGVRGTRGRARGIRALCRSRVSTRVPLRAEKNIVLFNVFILGQTHVV